MARTTRHARTRTRTRNHRGSAQPRLLPQELITQATEIVRDRPLDLPIEQRARLRALVAKSGGRGITLSPRERSEVSLLVARAATPSKRVVPTPIVASRRAPRVRAR